MIDHQYYVIPGRIGPNLCKFVKSVVPFLSRNKSISKSLPGGPIPQNMAQGFDAPPTLERSGSKHRRKALKALNPLLTAFRKSRPKIKAACNDANTTQNNIHSFHNYFFFYLYGVRSWRCRKLSIRSSLNVPSFHILSNSASAI